MSSQINLLNIKQIIQNREIFFLIKFVFVFILLSFLLISYLFYTENYLPQKDISFYYNELLKKENIKTNVILEQKDIDFLNKCKSIKTRQNNQESSMGSTNDCLKIFYEKYTLQNGTNKAFSHLHLLEKNYPQFVKDCHYISHGIGHAQLQISKGDVGEAFSVMAYDSFVNNIATCGNGYFHGVIEEFSKNEKTKEKLVKLLKPVCEKVADLSIENKKYRETDCYHGVGHAAFIQLEYDVQKGLEVCDELTDKEKNLYDCYSGVFMQNSSDTTVDKLVKVKDGIAEFVVCDAVAEKYKVACYNQNSLVLLRFTKNSKDIVKNINVCRQIKNDLYRLSCVNMFAGWSFTNRVKDIKSLCIAGTSSRAERISCVGTLALRTSRSLDINREGDIYKNAITDICKNLNFIEQKVCIDNVLSNPLIISIPSLKTLQL